MDSFDVVAARAAAVARLEADPDVELITEREMALDDNARHGRNREDEMAVGQPHATGGAIEVER